MKTICALLLSICAALAVTVSWDHPSPSNVTFRVYQSADVMAPYSEWQLVQVTTNLSALVPMAPAQMFFVVSASYSSETNFWGEVFSDVASTPVPPLAIKNLRIRRD